MKRSGVFSEYVVKEANEGCLVLFPVDFNGEPYDRVAYDSFGAYNATSGGNMLNRLPLTEFTVERKDGGPLPGPAYVLRPFERTGILRSAPEFDVVSLYGNFHNDRAIELDIQYWLESPVGHAYTLSLNVD